MGMQAGIAIRKVVAPEPSRWQIQPIRKVPMHILTGSSPVKERILLIIGSNTPASEQVLKNRIAKMNITPVATIEVRPAPI